jgi:ArsR family transcriptional regulator
MKRTGTRTTASVARLQSLLKALADTTRLRILALLGNNEVCVCHLHDSLGLPQPTVSRHLAYLRRAGLVDTRRDGVWMHYQVARSLEPHLQKVLRAAVEAVTSVPTSAQDRRQFQRAFGDLYVLPTATGGSCCAPRAPSEP